MKLDRDAIKVRIDAARDATIRSRLALLASTVAALSLLIAEFNGYVSWNRDFALADHLANANSPTGIAQRHLLSDWVSSSSMNISLLGIRVNIADATILGGIALFFLTLWFFYSMRRENRLVGTLLRDTRDADLDLIDLAYSGVVSYMVFTAVRPDKPKIASLADKPIKRSNGNPEGREKDSSRTFFGAQLLFFLPPFAIMGSLLFDFLTITYLSAPFRETHQIPDLRGDDLTKFFAIMGIGVIGLIATTVNCYRIHALDRATGTILREYSNMLKQKRFIRRQLSESSQIEKESRLQIDEYGITSDIKLNGTAIQILFDISGHNPRTLRAISERINEIKARAYPGESKIDLEKAEHKHILAVTPPIQHGDPVEYAIRETIRIRRLLRAYVDGDTIDPPDAFSK